MQLRLCAVSALLKLPFQRDRNQKTDGLTTTEKTLLDQAIHDLGQWDTDHLITKSHQETAWQANADNKSQWVNYWQYGF